MRTTQGTKILILLIILSIFTSQPLILAQDTKTTAPYLETAINTTQENISLQNLINNAEPGTILQLPPGIYQEILIINKPLHITGSNTIINPTSQTNGYAIWITTENVTLSNLDVTNQALGLYTTTIKISAPNTIIDHCILHDTPIGIAIWNNNTTITSCNFHHCSDEGIVLLGTLGFPCINTTITNSIFSENCDGIELQYASFTQIISCAFTKNTHAGIDAIESHNNNNKITNCTFTNNDAYGIYLAHSTQNLITSCTFTQDTLTLIHATHNILQNSQIIHIHLLNNSSLILDQCINITSDTIISEYSTYEIRTPTLDSIISQNEPPIPRYQQILYYFLSHLKAIKTFIERFSQERM